MSCACQVNVKDGFFLRFVGAGVLRRPTSVATNGAAIAVTESDVSIIGWFCRISVFSMCGEPVWHGCLFLFKFAVTSQWRH